MKQLTAAVAFAFFVLGGASAQAQISANPQLRTPPAYRLPVTPRSHAFAYRYHRHHVHRRHYRYRFFPPLPVLAGPAVIYRNGDVEIPPEHEITGSIAPPVAEPVVHVLGESGGCDLQQVNVPGGLGRTTVNIWRC